MRAVIQRVVSAAVTVDAATVGSIGPGLLVLLGIAEGDDAKLCQLMADKVAHLRIFSTADGKFNLSMLDTGGAALVVSQFTLLADTRRGRRPSFVHAAAPALAAPLVDHFCERLRSHGVVVATGVFGAHMQVQLVNDGPVTIILDSADTQRAP